MSTVGPGAFLMICDRYLPRPSCVMPRCTLTPSFGTFANATVLLGHSKMASETSLPTLLMSTSMAAEISTSLM